MLKTNFNLESLFVPGIIYLVIAYVIFCFLYGVYQNIFYPLRQRLKKKNESGYILTPSGEYEHRSIVEKIIKRKLQVGEEVHHINGYKWDNRKRNLALMTREEHLRWHKKLEWMWSKKYKTPMRWQRSELVKNFGAKLF